MKIVKIDGSANKSVGIKKVFEAGDKSYEQFGEFIYLEKDATTNDYDGLVNKVLRQALEFIKSSGKVWDLEGSQFIAKTTEDYRNNLKNLQSIGMKVDMEEDMKELDGKVGTLGFKVVLSRIVEEGEDL